MAINWNKFRNFFFWRWVSMRKLDLGNTIGGAAISVLLLVNVFCLLGRQCHSLHFHSFSIQHPGGSHSVVTIFIEPLLGCTPQSDGNYIYRLLFIKYHKRPVRCPIIWVCLKLSSMLSEFYIYTKVYVNNTWEPYFFNMNYFLSFWLKYLLFYNVISSTRESSMLYP